MTTRKSIAGLSNDWSRTTAWSLNRRLLIFNEWSFCYRVSDGQRLIGELKGDFRQLRPGQLVTAATDLVATLLPAMPAPRTAETFRKFPIASLLPPMRTSTTWFSSGRAAFAWILGEHLAPRRIHLPTLICWSLINVSRARFPEIELMFYPVNRHLEPCYPADAEATDALLFIHYFGHVADTPAVPNRCLLLEDCSHLLNTFQPASSGSAFGSLRKVYRTADGGFVRGTFNPVYVPDAKLDSWLRCEAIDWKDLREAENMTDRHWKISDISGQSLATVLSSDDEVIGTRRRENESILLRNLRVGEPMKHYAADECPLLHNRLMPTVADRDSLKSFLASRDIYCSIHWPTHPLVIDAQDQVDMTDALWIQDHIVSIPVAQDYGPPEMDQICRTCDEWEPAGSARFTTPAA